MDITLWLIAAVFFLAYSNGANDNSKGVATLFGSGTTNYRGALLWATATTLAGSVTALLLSGRLLAAFSGKGLVPDALTRNSSFLLAVGMATAVTVLIATLTGWPISTTHALIGGLVGAGLAANGTVQFSQLRSAFLWPLAFSPLLSVALTTLLYPSLRFARARLGVERQMCVCFEDRFPEPVRIQPDGSAVVLSTGVSISVAQASTCAERYQGRVLGFDAQWILDRLHYLSAGAVSFARGLNDTPKIVAILVAASAFQIGLPVSMVVVGLCMAAGGLLNARRVAATMGVGITKMNHGQGFTANLVTAFMVILASRWGMPVSTTHVSCGSLFGLGAITRQGQWKMVRNIILSWVITLPTAAVLAGAAYRLL